MSVYKVSSLEKFSIPEACRLSGVDFDDLTEFYILKNYIRKELYGYSATALGIKKGCFVNDKNRNALMTIKGICKVGLAFSA